MNAQTPTDLDAAIAADERRRFLLRAKKMILESRTSLLSFAQYMRPNPKNLGNPLDSVYQVEPHHAFIADRLEALERGDITRLILSVPPRHGKSELASKTFIPWAVGRNPDWSIIMATYNQNFAGDFGRAVRGTLQDPRYHQVFPDLVLQAGSKAADRMNTESGSQLTFVGRGGSLTGRGGHCLLGDTLVMEWDVRKQAHYYTPVRELVNRQDPSYVLAYDTETNKTRPQKITGVSRRQATGLRRITTAGGRMVVATAEHPFYVGGRWVEAHELAPGDPFLCLPEAQKTSHDVASTEADTVALVEDVSGTEWVYDIEVENDHNFFANGILVHNCLIIDDPIKDRKEADSGLVRDQLWTWYTQVFLSRAMVDDVRVLLIQTRWSEDDLIGRLTDKHNPNYSHTEAAKWEVINLPALANDDDPLGRKKGEPLWPKRFGTGFLAGMRDQDARGFSALYQGEPAPDTGLFFGPDDIREYHKMDQVPKNLRIYGASDHAVSTEQWADKTCLMMFGVDEEDNIWIFPETRLDKIPSNTQVEIMLNLIKKRRPMFWFAEKGHITKSIGPFLRKRMQEEGVWTGLFELTPTTDKQQRAQSIKGRMAAQKVFFPSFASWYQEARRQILTFPAGAKDDFVDTLSMVGLGLSMQVKAKPRKSTGTTKPGTFGALKAETRKRDLRRKLAEQRDGW